MMDELELLKKDWQKKDKELPVLSGPEIYKMLWKKSSSIVKWIFIISILEFSLPHLLYLIPSVRNGVQIYDDLGLKSVALVITAIQYVVVAFFILLFYKRYKEISVLDNAKTLMQNIIKTRRTVKYYVIFCLGLLLITYASVVLGIYLNDHLAESLHMTEETQNIPPEKLKVGMMWLVAIMGVVVTAVMAGVYFLLYGLLLRKLNRNYKTLKHLED